MEGNGQELSRLVSLTFDESPKVRLHAAARLEKIEDPAALFAIMELSYDKDPAVKKAAMNILDRKKKDEKEVMSFAEIFSQGDKEEAPTAGATQAQMDQEKKDKVLFPITALFEKKLGKEKADRVKSKMMPTIEKIYLKTVSHEAADSDSGRRAMQEFLTSYLEAVSDIGHVGGGLAHQAEEAPGGQGGARGGAHGKEHAAAPTAHDELAGEVETIGGGDAAPEQDAEKIEAVGKEVRELEAQEVSEEKEEKMLEKLPDTVFKRAYESMMLSGGDDELMRREMKRLTHDMEKDVRLAYGLAKKRFKETKVTHLTKLRDGMRNVNTDVLSVQSAEHMEYEKPKKLKASMTRALVKDEEGNEGVLYLFDDRGMPVKAGMSLRVVRGIVKSFTFSGSGETALTVGRKGNVYIVL